MKSNNLLFLIALVVGLGVVYVALDQAYSTGEVARSLSCFDSDGGLFYDVKGYVNYGGSYYNDTCRPNQLIIEYYCGSSGRLSSKNHRCSSGCFDGKCLALQTCANDCSSSGLNVCDSSASYKICGNFDSDPCLELSNVSSYCAAGYTCSDGSCVQSSVCSDDCSLNSKLCVDSVTYKTCGNYDSDSCLEWGSSVSSCALNEVCQDNACVSNFSNVTFSICSNECSVDSVRCLNSTGYSVCGNFDSDSCLEWSSWGYSCAPGYSCSYGICLQQNNQSQVITQTGSCTDSDLDNIVIKGYVSNGNETYSDFCGSYNNLSAVYEYTCDGNSVKGSYFVCDSAVGAVGSCYDGACIKTPVANQSCIDLCYSNWPSCTSNNTASWFAPCGNYDSDSCLEWGPVQYCSTSTGCSCQNGVCSCQAGQDVPSCSNECSVDSVRCLNSTGYSVCGNFDSDSCLEWSSWGYSCAPGYSCSYGVCVLDNVNQSSCSDDCILNSKSCVGSSSYKACGYYDNDTCLDWSSISSCSASEICQNGACVFNSTSQNQTVSCTDQCALGSSYCFGSSGYIPCGNFDSDPCLEFGYIDSVVSCSSNQTCSNGKCVATNCFDSDDGDSPSWAGNVTYNGALYADYCKNSTSIVEYYCSYNQLKSFERYCSHGCSNNQCLYATDPALDQRVRLEGCVDGDNGKDYFTESWTLAASGFPSSGSGLVRDRCSDTGELTEWSCSSTNRLEYAYYKCPYGCVHGHCCDSTSNCTLACVDSDKLNYNIYQKSTVMMYGTQQYSDYCEDNFRVHEYDCGLQCYNDLMGSKCYYDALSQKTASCPYGCSNGYCLYSTDLNIDNQIRSGGCVDTDGGINYDVNGSVLYASSITDSSGTHLGSLASCLETCFGGVTLSEAYCSTNSLGGNICDFVRYNCSNGCFGGRCI